MQKTFRHAVNIGESQLCFIVSSLISICGEICLTVDLLRIIWFGDIFVQSAFIPFMKKNTEP